MRNTHKIHLLNQKKKRIEEIATQVLSGIDINKISTSTAVHVENAIDVAEELVKQLEDRHVQAILKEGVNEKLRDKIT